MNILNEMCPAQTLYILLAPMIGNPKLIINDDLENGRYPRSIRKERNKAFLDALPEWIPCDLAKWMCKYYIDQEKCTVKLGFGDINSSTLNIKTVSVHGIGYNLEKWFNIYLKTPLMIAPFYGTKDYKGSHYNFALNIDTSQSSHNTFYKNILFIERNVMQYAVDNCLDLFSRRIPFHELTGNSFQSQIKHTSDNQYPPYFRFKLNKDDERCLCFDNDRNRITLNDFVKNITRNTMIQAIIRVCYIWQSGYRYGVRYIPVQLRYVKSFEQRVDQEYLFEESD